MDSYFGDRHSAALCFGRMHHSLPLVYYNHHRNIGNNLVSLGNFP